MDYDIVDSVRISIEVPYLENLDSVKIAIQADSDILDSTNVAILPYRLVGVTNICGSTYNYPTNPIVLDPTNPLPTRLPTPGEVTEVVEDNPFYPTIIIGGITLVYNASTAL